MSVSFSEEASARLGQEAEEAGKSVLDYCRDMFKSYEHALNLLSKASEGSEFVIDKDSVGNPGAAFERWIRETYQ